MTPPADTTSPDRSRTRSPSRFGIVTDSNSQITPDLIDRFDIEVVPITVSIDGREFEEGVDLGADAFYAHFANGRTPEVATSQPSPGAFAAAYRRVVDRGYAGIVSIHVDPAMSGTVAAAELAARHQPVPVEVVATTTASFGVAACAWAAAAAREAGAGMGDAVERMRRVEQGLGTVFMIGVPLLTERGGRVTDVDLDGDGIPILAMAGGELDVLDRVATIDEAVAAMSAYARSWVVRHPAGVTVAIGTADAPSRPLTDRLATAISDEPGIDGVVHYRVGPSVGAHTGPGTFGLFVFPTIA